MDKNNEPRIPFRKEDQPFFDQLVEKYEEISSENPTGGNEKTFLNLNRLEQMQFTYAVLQYITQGQNVKLYTQINQPFESMGVVSIEGNPLCFTQSEWFARAAEFANNVEVYPMKNNGKAKVRINFTFYGLKVPKPHPQKGEK